MTPQVARVLEAASSACSFTELQAAAGLKDRVHFLKTHLEPILHAGWIERTITDERAKKPGTPDFAKAVENMRRQNRV